MTSASDRVTLRGHRMTRRQRAAILAVEEATGVTFTIYQGSWRPQTSYSGTTHTGAGVIDIGLPNMGDNDDTRRVTRRLRDVGCQAAFLRGPEPFGGFSWHWHVCDLMTAGMDVNARWQVDQYRHGYDGLHAGSPDPVPYRPANLKEFDYRAWENRQTRRAKLRAQLRELGNRIKSLSGKRRRLARRIEKLS